MKITYYKLHSKDEDLMEVYIGSTEHFKRRKNEHKSECKRNWIQPIYMFINVNGGFDNWAFEILDEIEVESKEDRLKIERKFIEKYPLNLNYEVPGRTRKEWQKTHPKKTTKEQEKIWSSQKIECECGSIVRKYDRKKHFRSQKHINYIELNK
tara:strand:- start:11 stop:469 length:459 start_codon:yes stop_codon:yes gene_type:complete